MCGFKERLKIKQQINDEYIFFNFILWKTYFWFFCYTIYLTYVFHTDYRFFKLLILEEEYYSNLISTLSKIEFFMEKLPFVGTLIGSKNGLNKTFLNGV